MIKSFSDLDIYKLSFRLAMDVFNVSKSFPVEEKYSLTSQIIRSTRSVSANIAEGFGKRFYENEFKWHLVYSTGSLEESRVWLKFALSVTISLKFNLLLSNYRLRRSEQSFLNFSQIGNPTDHTSFLHHP